MPLLAFVFFALFTIFYPGSTFANSLDPVLCDTVSDVSLEECGALVDLYNATDGDTWNDSTNRGSPDVCTRYGVTCGNGVIVGLLLNNNNLVGEIPQSFYTLSSLQGLDLSSNKLFGTFFPEEGELEPKSFYDIIALSIADNQFTNLGNLMPYFSQLIYVDMSNNLFSQAIDGYFSQVSQLQYFDIHNNQFMGSLDFLENNENIQYIDISVNQFSNDLPDFSQLNNLEYFDAHDNTFTSDITRLSQQYNRSLQYLNLNNNQLQGTLAMLQYFPSLQTFFASGNLLTGSFPYLSNGNIEYLDISHNTIGGDIKFLTQPALQNIKIANLSHNQFVGIFPSFGKPMKYINITNNFIEGVDTRFSMGVKNPAIRLQNNCIVQEDINPALVPSLDEYHANKKKSRPKNNSKQSLMEFGMSMDSGPKKIADNNQQVNKKKDETINPIIGNDNEEEAGGDNETEKKNRKDTQKKTCKLSLGDINDIQNDYRLTYDITTLTNTDVISTLTFSDENNSNNGEGDGYSDEGQFRSVPKSESAKIQVLPIVNNGGSGRYTFEQNGEFFYEVRYYKPRNNESENRSAKADIVIGSSKVAEGGWPMDPPLCFPGGEKKQSQPCDSNSRPYATYNSQYVYYRIPAVVTWIDKEPPTTPIIDGKLYNREVSLDFADEHLSGAILSGKNNTVRTVVASGDVLSTDGEYCLTIDDLATNTTTVCFEIDTIAPEVSLIDQANKTLQILLSDKNFLSGTLSGVDNTLVVPSLGTNYTLTQFGKFILKAYDRAGNSTVVIFTKQPNTTTSSNTTSSSTSSSGGGGGGGGTALSQDVCPGGDQSPSYYDKTCGQKNPDPDTNGGDDSDTTDQPVFHGSADEPAIDPSVYGVEQTEAYLWALKYGITSIGSIDNARLTNNLTRRDLAKMMVQYAKNVVNYDEVVNKRCSFSDTSNEPKEIRDFIDTSCTLGLMGLKADGTPDTIFNPDKRVSRAEFGTVLSRFLYGSKFNLSDEEMTQNDAPKWYAKHLGALRTYDIMTQVDGNRPKNIEKRGFVRVMLQRSSTAQGSRFAGKIATIVEQGVSHSQK